LIRRRWIDWISGWLASNPVVGALLPSGFTESLQLVTPISGLSIVLDA
jgi:hypothetical protein